MKCHRDMIQYSTVREAMQDADIALTSREDTSLLIWRDSISNLINYGSFRSWQIINRIPLSNIICRKIPLCIVLRESQSIFPNYYDFIPETFILPDEIELFQEKLSEIKRNSVKEFRISRENLIKKSKCNFNENFDQLKLIKKHSKYDRSRSCSTNYKLKIQSKMSQRNESSYEDEADENLNEVKDEFLIKPSNGSLGKGIRIIRTGDAVTRDSFCDCLVGEKPVKRQCSSVAQKYIKSHLIEDRKFDLRIYVLISSVDPFEIYVYRDGLARFCPLKWSSQLKFSKITNVTMNKNSSFCNQPEKISRLISDVFAENFTDEQQKSIWEQIDDLVVLTLFCSHRYLLFGLDKFIGKNRPSLKVEKFFYSKCFQIFGFDILLSQQNLKPFLIEVNYRPSLDFLRNVERRMKVDMIKDALRIAAPYAPFQELLNQRKHAFESDFWDNEILSQKSLFMKSLQLKKMAVSESKYKRVWPFRKEEIRKNPMKFELFSQILDKLDKLPVNDQLVKI